MSENQSGQWELSPAVQDVDLTKAQQKILHATIKKVTEDIESLGFNTAISQMMIFVNAFIPQRGTGVIPVSAMRTFLVLLNPFAPHLSSELWEKLKSTGDITERISHRRAPFFQQDYDSQGCARRRRLQHPRGCGQGGRGYVELRKFCHPDN